MLDCVFVVLEMLIDLGYIPLDEPNVFPDVLHGFSIAVLSAFMVEISLKVTFSETVLNCIWKNKENWYEPWNCCKVWFHADFKIFAQVVFGS